MKRKMMALGASVIGSVVLLSACATTRITSDWQNPEIKNAGPYRKIFLTAITEQDTVRRQFEDAFRTALNQRGLVGVPSYEPLPIVGKVQKEQLAEAVRSVGADAALIFRLVRRENRVAITPVYYGPTGYYHGYYAAWDSFYEPKSVYQFEVITLEAKLYDATSQKLVWAVSTESEDPGKLQKEVAAYAKLIIGQMEHDGLVRPSSR